MLVHGDDFFAIGRSANLQQVNDMLTSKYQAKWEIIGPKQGMKHDTKIIGRIVKFVPGGIDIEVDTSYIESAIADYNLISANATATPAARPAAETREQRTELLLRRVLAGKPLAKVKSKRAASDVAEPAVAGVPDMGEQRAKSVAEEVVPMAQGSSQDYWINADGVLHRYHVRSRRGLFTPMKVSGSPPACSIAVSRVTEGEYLDSGEQFVIRDTWTERATAHKDLGRAWIGRTTFEYKPGVADCPEEAGNADLEADAEPDEMEEALTEQEVKQFQSTAAKLNFVAPDRPECLFATKECMRAMAKPTREDAEKLKRLLRYYQGRPRGVIQMRRGGDLSQTEAFVDADVAGCLKTRRSTCGGAILWGGGLVKAWSRTVATIALSSGESELAALTKGAAEGMGVIAILADFGVEAKLVLRSDATAALGIAARQGLGRLRHIVVADLWIQQRLKAKDFQAVKVDGQINCGDLMTKPLGAPRIEDLLNRFGVSVPSFARPRNADSKGRRPPESSDKPSKFCEVTCLCRGTRGSNDRSRV